MADAPSDPFFDTLSLALGDRIDPAATSFLDLMPEDFVMEFPYARPGMQKRIEGRDAVLDYLVSVGDGISVDTIDEVEVHETGAPDVVIVEFTSHGQARKTGEPYENRYISVITTRDGKIAVYRDYWNQLAGLRARLGTPAVEAFVLGTSTSE